MTATTEHGERLARLEGAYDHLATKADIEALRGELKAFKWQVSLGVPILTVLVSQTLDRLI
ncbi:MAG: hypothetical protein OXJ55_09825 [Caldilineaceae bacterium]|nr:hypothetical protein [Caldilineaceae bacterium]MDE0462728.1 hypothetical protein [Caldilineaceae bacterium]